MTSEYTRLKNVAPVPRSYPIEPKAFKCTRCQTPIRRTRTNLCVHCYRKWPTMLCATCGVVCPTRQSGLCLKHWLILKGKKISEVVGIKHTILRVTQGLCNSSDGFHRCTLPLGHNGIHEETRDGKHFRWGRLCGALKRRQHCTLLARHRGDHRFGSRTWPNLEWQERERKRIGQKRCNVLTLSGSFHCIKKRGHSGRHQYVFQGRVYEWSQHGGRVILRSGSYALDAGRRKGADRSGHQSSGLETVGANRTLPEP
jgi:hypothetical protein